MELASNIIMVLVLIWSALCFASFLTLNLFKSIKRKKRILNKYYELYSLKMNITPKKPSFHSLGWVVYNGITKKISINSFFLLFSLKHTIKRLKREMKRQKIYEGKSDPEFYMYLSSFRQRSFWILFLVIWGNIILVYINQLPIEKEQVETIRSLLLFPSNILILVSLYQRFISKKRRIVRKKLIKELNS